MEFIRNLSNIFNLFKLRLSTQTAHMPFALSCPGKGSHILHDKQALATDEQRKFTFNEQII
jgi:hypothetical protein